MSQICSPPSLAPNMKGVTPPALAVSICATSSSTVVGGPLMPSSAAFATFMKSPTQAPRSATAYRSPEPIVLPSGENRPFTASRDSP